MMMNLCCDIIKALNGRTLATAESCTGGGIGMALTAVPGSSQVYKGGVITYTNEIKSQLLGIDPELISREGAVSPAVAEAMARGVINGLHTDFAVSVTGLAGPGGDEFGNPVGTVYIGFSDGDITVSQEYHFAGDRAAVRQQAIISALQLVLKNI